MSASSRELWSRLSLCREEIWEQPLATAAKSRMRRPARENFTLRLRHSLLCSWAERSVPAALSPTCVVEADHNEIYFYWRHPLRVMKSISNFHTKLLSAMFAYDINEYTHNITNSKKFLQSKSVILSLWLDGTRQSIAKYQRPTDMICWYHFFYQSHGLVKAALLRTTTQIGRLQFGDAIWCKIESTIWKVWPRKIL